MNRRLLSILFVALFGWTSLSHAATFVNVSDGILDTSSTTVVTSGAVHTAGNGLFGWVKWEGSATTVTVTNTAGDTWTVSPAIAHANAVLRGAFFYVCSTAGNASDVVTITFGAAQSFKRVQVIQASGQKTTGCLDKDLSGSGTGTALATNATTNTQANSYIVAFSGEYASQTYTAGTGFTIRLQNIIASEDKNVTTCGTYDATMTQSVSADWLLGGAIIKDATAGASCGGGGAETFGFRKRIPQ